MRLRIINEVRVFPRKIGIFQREIWSYLRTVSSRVIEKFSSVKRLDGCIQGLRKLKFEILGCLGALEDCK